MNNYNQNFSALQSSLSYDNLTDFLRAKSTIELSSYCSQLKAYERHLIAVKIRFDVSSDLRQTRRAYRLAKSILKSRQLPLFEGR